MTKLNKEQFMMMYKEDMRRKKQREEVEQYIISRTIQSKHNSWKRNGKRNRYGII